jgi:arsenite methyltransferase
VAVDVWRDGDLSGNGPEALRANAVAEGVEGRVQIVTGDAAALDLADGSVDVVVSVLCLHNIEPEAARLAALGEIVRVLRPGGRAIVADYIKTGEYARVFRAAGMVVRGPLRMEAVALSLSAVVVADKL